MAWITCSKRQVTVSGPTPPTFGVMAVRSVRFRISSLTSPSKIPFSLAVPASTMTAAGLTISEVMRFGTPVAVTITS